MKNEGIPIVREGIPFLGVSLLAAIAFAIGGIWPLSFFFFLVSAYIVYFFRNPERLPPVGAGIVAAPADGRIVFAGMAQESEFLNTEMQKVSIFMSLFDVHVNRAPIDGIIKNMKYHRGSFLAASEDRASEENERNSMLIEVEQGNEKLVLVQVAGLVARRIICYPVTGAFILRGQRIGLIRFGSRCDVYFPKSARIDVKLGDRVVGGETILGVLQEGTRGSQA